MYLELNDKFSLFKKTALNKRKNLVQFFIKDVEKLVKEVKTLKNSNPRKSFQALTVLEEVQFFSTLPSCKCHEIPVYVHSKPVGCENNKNCFFICDSFFSNKGMNFTHLKDPGTLNLVNGRILKENSQKHAVFVDLGFDLNSIDTGFIIKKFQKNPANIEIIDLKNIFGFKTNFRLFTCFLFIYLIFI